MECDLAAGPEFSLERVGCGPITDWDLEYFRLKNDENGPKIEKIPGIHCLTSSGEGIGPPGGLAVVPAMKIDKFFDILI